jgi:hypothetical protein
MAIDPRPNDVVVSAADVRRAVSEGILDATEADRLLAWAAHRAPAPPPREQRKGFNLVTVVYYFGALLMISACAWFLGQKWESFGSPGILVTCLVYAAIAVAVGVKLRAEGFMNAGGLLVTVAVSLTPLVTYTIEDMLGIWPIDHPGKYERFYPWIHGSWIVMELATIATAALALRFVRFGFLVAPLAFSFWFFSMDVAAVLARVNDLSWDDRKWVSVGVGLLTMAVGYGLDRTLRRDEHLSEDFPFWCYLFGLLAFWGGLTSMNSGSELGRFVYLLVNVGLVGIALMARRVTFLVFGALGSWIYVGHLAYKVFKDSAFFPFAIALIGLGMILSTVWAQRRFSAHLALLQSRE